METTDTRRQQLQNLRAELASLNREHQSLQIRLHDRWSQAQWLMTHASPETVTTVTSESLTAEIETMRARQLAIREAIRELKARIRGLQASR